MGADENIVSPNSGLIIDNTLSMVTVAGSNSVIITMVTVAGSNSVIITMVTVAGSNSVVISITIL